MRWNTLLLLLIALNVSSCSMRRHASQGKPEKRSRPAPMVRPGNGAPADRERAAPSRSLDTEAYIRLYSALAVEEMQRSGVPASITLAQGILESGNGNSRLAREANNHFGIKCTPEWRGGKTYKDDDRRNECFRVYRTVYESYKDHSEFLKRARYRFLFDLDPTDYKGWAHGLKKAGYATNPRYAHLLIDLIERYDLDHFDRLSGKERKAILASEPRPSPETRPGSGVNGTPATMPGTSSGTGGERIAGGGSPSGPGATEDTPPASARTTPLSPGGSPANPGAASGSAETTSAGAENASAGTPAVPASSSHYYYQVRQGDTLYAISRRFGITVDELKQWNDLSSNSISAGQQLRVSR